MNRFDMTIGLLVLLLAGCGGGNGTPSGTGSESCPAPPPSTSPAGSLASVVDGIAASDMMARHLPGLAISVSRQGTVLYAQGYGYASLESCVPVQASTAFQIGSVTKQFTAAAVLRLVDAGRVGLDRAVSDLLPAYGFDAKITVRMLLNHTSGLADYTGFPEAVAWTGGVTSQTVLTRIAQAPPLFSPGAAYSYSDSNYYILGSIIEAITGLSYEEYLTANVLRPALLDHTTYRQPVSFASPYTLSWTAGALWDPSFAFASGALWSNVLDLAAWNGALTNSSIIPESLFALTVTPPDVPISGQSAPSQYGMGWLRTTQLGRPFVLHDGKTASYSAFNGMFLDTGYSIAIATNVELPDGASFEGTAITLINALCGPPQPPGAC